LKSRSRVWRIREHHHHLTIRATVGAGRSGAPDHGDREVLYGSLCTRGGAVAGAFPRPGGTGRVILFRSIRSSALGTVLTCGIDEHELEAYWPHKLIPVSDQKRALLGGADNRRRAPS
jgi:hypothetical protein